MHTDRIQDRDNLAHVGAAHTNEATAVISSTMHVIKCQKRVKTTSVIQGLAVSVTKTK